MIEVEEMGRKEIDAVLEKVSFGHLGCSSDNVPYVIPIHFAYKKPSFYIYTTEGKKFEMISDNPIVCLQVEDIASDTEWRSVIVTGKAVQITDPEEREEVMAMITKSNPTLTPAISIRWMDNWIRENREVLYRIRPETVTGRTSGKVVTRAPLAKPSYKKRPIN